MSTSTPLKQDLVVIREKVNYHPYRNNPYPTGLAIDPNSQKIYVSDWKANCIDIFKQDLVWERLFNKTDLKSPRGLRFKHNKLYVSESNGNLNHFCIKVFHKNGVLTEEISGWGGNLRLQYSLSLDVDTFGNLFICEATQNATIKISSGEGNLIAQFGYSYLKWPIDIRIYKTLIYVLDYDTKCMCIFDLLNFNFVTKFKMPKHCTAPTYFLINHDNDLVIVDKFDQIFKINELHVVRLIGPETKRINRKGIEMNSQGELVNVYQQDRGCLQIIEDPHVVSF